jgi:hypothetical protein
VNGEYLIHPGIGMGQNGQQPPPVGPILWKMIFSLFICFIGIMW